MRYSRIIEIDPARRGDLFTHAAHGVTIRPARSGGPNEYVIETTDPNECRAVDKIKELFNVEEAS